MWRRRRSSALTIIGAGAIYHLETGHSCDLRIGSVSGRWLPTVVLTLTGTKQPFGAAQKSRPNGGYTRYCGRRTSTVRFASASDRFSTTRTHRLDPLLPATDFQSTGRSTLKADIARSPPAAKKSRLLPFDEA